MKAERKRQRKADEAAMVARSAGNMGRAFRASTSTTRKYEPKARPDTK
jgi:hypothetical protein